MFKTFFLSELKYVLKQPMVYIFLGLITLLVFGATVSDNVSIGGSVGNVYRNAPHIITIYTTVMTIFGLLMATAFFNNAALRDYSNDFNEILFSSPISKAGYYFGRFFSALILATIPMLGVFIGIYVGAVLAPLFGWISADRFGPFYLETLVNNYFLFILPNMLFAGAIIFAMAHKWKSTVVSFLGTLIIIVAYITSGTLMSDLSNEKLAALLDVFGIQAYTVFSKYFTTIERNTISPSFTGILLWNRLIWISIGLIILIISYFCFSFKEKNKKVKAGKASLKEEKRTYALPKTQAVFNRKTEWLQFKSFFITSLLSIVKSVTFKILFLFSIILLVTGFIGGFDYFGLQSYPVTYKMIDNINESSSIFIIIILVFFSGELIWRDRDSKINEVIDATPHTSLISLAAKAFSLITITTCLYLFFIVCAVIYQLLNGYTRIELDVYLLNFFYSSFFYYIVLSGIFILIQTIFNNKYIGYFISILVAFIWTLILSILDIQTNMLAIGGSPSVFYSDMNGFGPGVKGTMWFNIYWLLFSLLCLIIAGALWNRGVLSSLKNKIKYSKKQLPRQYRFVFVACLLAWLFTAGFVYYNTQILNPYKTSDQLEELSVSYEKKYKKFEHVALPKVTDVQNFIDIFPEKRDVTVKAIVQLTNESNQPIDSLHFLINEDWETTINIPNAKLAFEDKEIGYRIYVLQKPMQPNEKIETVMHTSYVSKGFENTQGNTNIIENGTFLNNFDILPVLGYREDMEISDPNKRKKHNLPPKERMPALQENCTQLCRANYLTNGRADFIPVETTISTSLDQIAVAPGSLLKNWQDKDRNYFHYKVDHPSQYFYSFISARYEVAKRKWKDVDIEVYYDKKHSVNIERMLDAVQRSLEYYTKNFGPYFHKQCRIIEFPRYANFAQAFPGTMPYSESFGFIINLENDNDNNVVDAVIAHEMAHQWWAHQLLGANMQGATMLSESFSEYSALMTMKSINKDPMKMRKFLKYDYDRYLRGRSSEIEKELPLYKVENQTYIHYGKGSVILYALQDYIGEAKLNTALRNFLEAYRYQSDPYPTTLNFLSYLEPEVPDSLKYLITDWIKEITLYDNRMKEATYEKTAQGKYKITMKVSSVKIKADSLGNETRVPINDWIDLGAFSDQDEKKLVFVKRVKIDQPEMTFHFELDSLPKKVAIDPKMLLIDRIYDDNTKEPIEKEK